MEKNIPSKAIKDNRIIKKVSHQFINARIEDQELFLKRKIMCPIQKSINESNNSLLGYFGNLEIENTLKKSFESQEEKENEGLNNFFPNELPKSYDQYLKILTQKDNMNFFLRAVSHIKKDFQNNSDFYLKLSKENDNEILLIIDNLMQNSKIIFKKKKYMQFLIQFYNSLYQESKEKLDESNKIIPYTDPSKVLLEKINIEEVIMINNHTLFIQLFKELKCFRHKEILFSKLNNNHTWIIILGNAYNYPLLEYLIGNYLTEKEFKEKNLGESLFKILEDHFLEYCIGEYLTFVMQKYIQHHFSKKMYKLVKSNFQGLIFNKKGIYVLITTIKTLLSMGEENIEYKNYSNKIMKKILNFGEIICKDTYGSTLAEYVFSNYKIQAIEYFLANKSNYLLGK